MTSDHERPFQGLKIGFEANTNVLVLEDQLDERRPVLERLLRDCQVTWASDIQQVQKALDSHGPFDAYCLDYDLGDIEGGWLAGGQLIRESDPLSVAKIVIVHSANPEARVYYSLFPGAIIIQWRVLATILGVPMVSNALVEAVLNEAGSLASEEQIIKAALRVGQSS